MLGGGITKWYQSELVALGLELKTYCHTILYVFHVGMIVNVYYMYCVYIHSYHSIYFVVHS